MQAGPVRVRTPVGRSPPAPPALLGSPAQQRL